MNRHNRRIENPCPMLLSRMKRADGGFHCGSCSKKVVDFRGKSKEQVKAELKPGMRGVFEEDQLPDQRRLSFFKRTVFLGLMALSFFGFQVKPLNGQVQDTAKNVGWEEESKRVMQNGSQEEELENPVCEKAEKGKASKTKLRRRRWRLFRKKRFIAGRYF